MLQLICSKIRLRYTWLVVLLWLMIPARQAQAAAFNADSLQKRIAVTSGTDESLKNLHLLIRGYLSITKPDSANIYLQKALALSNNSSNDTLRGMTWYLHGKLHIFLRDYDQAMTSFIEADKIFKSARLMKEHGLTEMQFGILLYTQQNYKSAGDYFKSAFNLLNAASDTLNAITTQYLLGLTLTELRKYDEAVNVLKESLLMCMRFGYMQRAMESRMGLAEAYLRMDRNEESIREAGIALEYYDSTEVEGSTNQSGKARAEYIIGKSASGIGRFELAEQMLERALKHELAGKRYDACVKVSEELIHVYDYLGKFKLAISQVQDMMSWKDSLKKSEAEQTLRVLEDRQNIQMQNARIELLTTQKENDQKIRFALIALAVLLLILAFNLYQRFKLKKESEKKMDELLLNILPSEVAEELKTQGKATSKLYSSVTVMFVDIVGFTKLTKRLSPEILVADLHRLFTGFDKISALHKLEKIKTLGDAYLCAGGVPVENDSHPFDTIAAAREMLAFLETYNIDRKEEDKIHVRIGIHTGPVVAGIVGIKKFAFDIWGDTVNIAARLEQNGEAGRINISGSTYDKVKAAIVCESRGEIEVKNRGEISMYFVV